MDGWDELLHDVLTVELPGEGEHGPDCWAAPPVLLGPASQAAVIEELMAENRKLARKLQLVGSAVHAFSTALDVAIRAINEEEIGDD